MVNPEFIEEQTVTLAEAKKVLQEVEKRDKELNYRSNKTKEFFDNFVQENTKNVDEELRKTLLKLDLTRLKEEHITSIINFLPTTVNDLKVILQAYPLSMPKKDQESIVKVVKEFVS
ncbi:hypothetical protein HOL21_01525 [Candidatus Woesearchaeota archaeon]|jgi:DNA-directed RNA polymerase subunit F|nr:hypothetical protein [Candidatus Woesearchaeota archaeon]MBT5396872.1 hypothetical protein [Candidatus Woesearchaeota archaeon]MBT5924868.1 hypothetical protein [Candidatus Woesearchaeota archaeon]MBT6367608.1 hypothetical protein [Candidatus Woesearchaeota archaeon]MBT7762370.1 hypothetical protein [Candidatus Woesearchaeota archaeon]